MSTPLRQRLTSASNCALFLFLLLFPFFSFFFGTRQMDEMLYGDVTTCDDMNEAIHTGNTAGHEVKGL